ncbi:amidohydrolase family protein [Streptomyces sp. NPDC050095]|uniref:amidohydrolase family protein n=1 Tax=unclassified Streptomyces TaxID=2593676 RepID=UPI00343E67D4
MTELLITAGRMLLGPDTLALEDAAVLITDSVIAAAGSRAAVQAQATSGHQALSFPDATVIPGLINCHVHLAFDAGSDPVAALRNSADAALLADMATRARQLLDAGVTTVRDLGDRDALAMRLRDGIAAGHWTGPRILTAGAPITSPQGHCWFLGGEAKGPDQIREAVRRRAQQGADVIKVMATGGGLTPGGPPIWKPQYTTEELVAAVEEARRASLPVAAHAHGTEGIAAAITAGVDTIEHCTWVTEHGGVDLCEDLVARIVSEEILVCLATHPNWRAFAERIGPERAQEVFAPARRMAEQGVRLIAGTDAGVPRSGFDGLASSLEFLEHIGMTRAEVIAAATTEAARALGIADNTGQLEPGYRADLIVLGSNPLDDLKALRDVRLVVAGGQAHFPQGTNPATAASDST